MQDYLDCGDDYLDCGDDYLSCGDDPLPTQPPRKDNWFIELFYKVVVWFNNLWSRLFGRY